MYEKTWTTHADGPDEMYAIRGYTKYGSYYSDQQSTDIIRATKSMPSVYSKEHYLSTLDLNGVQDEDYEYDKYLYDQWEASEDEDFLDQLTAHMTNHRNAWNDKQEYWQDRMDLRASEMSTMTYERTKRKTATRASHTDKTLKGETSSMTKMDVAPVYKSGLTQVDDKTL